MDIPRDKKMIGRDRKLKSIGKRFRDMYESTLRNEKNP